MIKDFQLRLDVGVGEDLVDLVGIGCLTGRMARVLFDAGFVSPESMVAKSKLLKSRTREQLRIREKLVSVISKSEKFNDSRLQEVNISGRFVSVGVYVDLVMRQCGESRGFRSDEKLDVAQKFGEAQKPSKITETRNSFKSPSKSPNLPSSKEISPISMNSRFSSQSSSNTTEQTFPRNTPVYDQMSHFLTDTQDSEATITQESETDPPKTDKDFDSDKNSKFSKNTENESDEVYQSSIISGALPTLIEDSDLNATASENLAVASQLLDGISEGDFTPNSFSFEDHQLESVSQEDPDGFMDKNIEIEEYNKQTSENAENNENLDFNFEETIAIADKYSPSRDCHTPTQVEELDLTEYMKTSRKPVSEFEIFEIPKSENSKKTTRIRRKLSTPEMTLTEIPETQSDGENDDDLRIIGDSSTCNSEWKPDFMISESSMKSSASGNLNNIVSTEELMTQQIETEELIYDQNIVEKESTSLFGNNRTGITPKVEKLHIHRFGSPRNSPSAVKRKRNVNKDNEPGTPTSKKQNTRSSMSKSKKDTKKRENIFI